MRESSQNRPRPTGPPPSEPGAAPKPWFETAFDDFYASLYAHRSDTEAVDLVTTLQDRGLEGPVIDVACGAGRLLRTLGRTGVRAYGFDLSRDLLRRARAGSEARGSIGPPRPLGVVCSDMRRWPFASGWAGTAIMLFTSFGYFDSRAEDLQVLHEAYRVLRPGGRFVLDFLNRTTTERDLNPRSERHVNGRVVVETRRIDSASSEGPYVRKRVEVRSPDATAPEVSYEERVRLYAPDELRHALGSSGFSTEESWGDYRGATFDVERSARCILLARRGAAT